MSRDRLFNAGKPVWRIYMAMLKDNGTVKQEGRIIKVTIGTTTKIYMIDCRNGKLVDIL